MTLKEGWGGSRGENMREEGGRERKDVDEQQKKKASGLLKYSTRVLNESKCYIAE